MDARPTKLDSPAFGFIDPSDVLHAAHLIPVFAHGQTNELLPPSCVCSDEDEDEDWSLFYVGRFILITSLLY